MITPFLGYNQCNTTVSFDTWLSGGQSTSQNIFLTGTLTQVQFNLNFSANGGEWPADMIVVITGALGAVVSIVIANSSEGSDSFPNASVAVTVRL